jgi:hypothetical protein
MKPLLSGLLLVSSAFGQSIMLLVGAGGAGSNVAAPTESPGAGTYNSTQTVTLSDATGSAAICYTIDGSTPLAATPGTCSHGATYSTTIGVAATTTIEAIGTKVGMTNSGVMSALYTIGGGSTPALVSHISGPAVIASGGGASTAIYTTGANFLIIAATNFGIYTVTDSKSNTWHALTSYGINFGFGMSYLIQTPNGATVNPTWTPSAGAGGRLNLIAAFRGM